GAGGDALVFSSSTSSTFLRPSKFAKSSSWDIGTLSKPTDFVIAAICTIAGQPSAALPSSRSPDDESDSHGRAATLALATGATIRERDES
ncbi:hypothetical protein THAOC_22266, partial [Thalassiosira oceanica]